MELRTCKNCNETLLINNFSNRQYTCKDCRNKKAKCRYEDIKDKKLEEVIQDRTPIRNELYRECIEEGWPIEAFTFRYIPLEKYREMVKQPDKWTFVRCPELLEIDKKRERLWNEKKFFIDGMFCSENFGGHRASWVYII